MSCSKNFYALFYVSAALSRNRITILKILSLLVPLAALSLCGCGDTNTNTNTNTSKILVRVNEEEITTRQLEDELAHENPVNDSNVAVTPAQRNQTLEVLIDRKLLLKEARRQKLDRDPKVLQIIERYKTQAIVQAYLETQTGKIDQPTKNNVIEFFRSHPELFTHRKLLNVDQLSIASANFTNQLKGVMNAGKSLDQVEAWLTAHKIVYIRTAVSYDSAELPADIYNQLHSLAKNRLFVLKDGDRNLLSAVTKLVDNPVPPALEKMQIERFLMAKNMQEIAAKEIARLRPFAKLEYVDKSDSNLEKSHTRQRQ